MIIIVIVFNLTFDIEFSDLIVKLLVVHNIHYQYKEMFLRFRSEDTLVYALAKLCLGEHQTCRL